MKKYRLLSIFLCLCLSVPMLSCGQSEKETETTPMPTQTETETAVETEPAYTLPTGDYAGHTFTILVTGNTESGWDKNDFAAEELTGELMNDAIYTRNTTVEELYNVRIANDKQYEGDGGTKGEGKGYQSISQQVLAGDAAYDAAAIAGYDACTLVLQQYLAELSALPHVDLSQPWWDQNAVADMRLNGKTYFTTGDISTAINDCTIAVFFNQQLAADNGITDLYDSVRDGSWTFDKLAGYAKMVASDLNGDGKYDANDRFGTITWDDTVMAAVNATGVKCASVGADGKLSLTLYNEAVVGMLEQYCDLVLDKSVSYNYQRVSYDITTPVSMFQNGQALYYMQLMNLASSLRDMEADFGILPFPKYDASQDRYYSTVGSWHSVFFCVPAYMEDAERTGAIVEALAYESREIVRPVYYDQILDYKYMRDADSVDMLDVILSTRVFDLGWFYKVGTYCDEVIYMIWQYTPNFTSRYEKFALQAQEDINRINESFSHN